MKTSLVPLVLSVLFLLSVPCFANVFNLGPGLTNLETVTVGDPGNVPDTRYATPGFGSVGYAYNIGKYEVTATQYTDFLNKVAATDTYSLYNTGMANTSSGSGITRGGVSGSYTYSVATGFINRPLNYVSFWDSVRFANWLHNGQPTGAQNASTTEDGAYFIDGYTGTFGQWIVRKPGAKWFIPSEDEWYKAAYYKGHGTNAGYCDYPTSSDTAPGRDMNDPSGNNANYYGSPYPIDNGKYTTVVGEFQNSPSPYGTFDQGGNVGEWNEAIVSQDFSINYASRGLRGGSHAFGDYRLLASFRLLNYPSSEENDYIGFRVAEAVPEPSSIMILVGGIAMIVGMKRRRA